MCGFKKSSVTFKTADPPMEIPEIDSYVSDATSSAVSGSRSIDFYAKCYFSCLYQDICCLDLFALAVFLPLPE